MFITRQHEEDVFGIVKRATMPAPDYCMICEQIIHEGDRKKQVRFIVCGFCRLKVE